MWVASLSSYANLPGFLEALVSAHLKEGTTTNIMVCCIMDSLEKPTSIEGLLKDTAKSSYAEVHIALIDSLPPDLKCPFVFRLSYDLICTNVDCKKVIGALRN